MKVGRYRDSLECFTYCLKTIEEKSGSKYTDSKFAEVLGYAGYAYLKMKKYEYAKKMYLDAIKVIRNCVKESNTFVNCWLDSANYWLALADIYFDEKKYGDALSCYNAAHGELSKISSGKDGMIGDLLSRKGSCYLRLKDYENAVKSLLEALSFKLESNRNYEVDDAEIAEMRFELGLGFYRLDKHDIALENWKKAIDVEMIHLSSESLVTVCIDYFLKLGERV